jgi:hypothetical protein
MLWRQGDVFVETIARLPEAARALPHLVLAEGELTGHAHRIEDAATAVLYEEDDLLYLEVTAEAARLIHEEHGTIVLPRGIHRVWKQREYVPPSRAREPAGFRRQVWQAADSRPVLD